MSEQGKGAHLQAEPSVFLKAPITELGTTKAPKPQVNDYSHVRFGIHCSVQIRLLLHTAYPLTTLCIAILCNRR
jgi:hypothetical protein